MESIIYTPRIIALLQEIFEVKRLHQEKQLIKLIKAVEILRQVPVQTEKHIRRVEFLLEQIRIQREIIAQWPLTHVLLRKQLQQPIIKLAIEQLLRKQEFFLEEPTLMTLPTLRRREVFEQLICEELVQLLKLQKEFVLPVLPWTTFEQELVEPTMWTNKVLPTQRRWVEKLLEQIELVFPRLVKEEEILSIAPLMKELVYNTMVPRSWFLETLKEKEQMYKHYFLNGEEKLVEKELIYNTMFPRCFEEEKFLVEKYFPTLPYNTMPVEKELIYKQVPRHFFEQEQIYNQLPCLGEEKIVKEIVLPTGEKIVKKEIILPTGEKIVKEIIVPAFPYTMPVEEKLVYKQVPRNFFEEEKLVEKVYQTTLPYTTMPVEKELIYNTMFPRVYGEEKIVKEVVLPTGEKIVKKEIILPTGQKVVKEIVVLPTGEMIVKKEIVVPTTPYTTLYNQVPRRHFLGQEEKLVEKELMYNTMIPRVYGEEKIVKEVVLPTGEKIVKKEVILPTGEKVVKEILVLPTGEKIVKKEFVVPTTPYTTLYNQVPRHFFEQEKLIQKELIQPTIMGLEQPIFCHYPEHILAHQPRRLF